MRSASRALATSGATGEITGMAAEAAGADDELLVPAEDDGGLDELVLDCAGVLGASLAFLAFSFSLRFCASDYTRRVKRVT